MGNKFIFTVSELTRHIKASMEPLYPDIWVEGEVSNIRIPASGHCYFTLKDESSQVRAVMFRAQRRRLHFEPEDGLKAVCRGRINVYEPRGEYQLIAELMEPRGIGDLQLAFEQLKTKLQQEGLFDHRRKKNLPMLPRTIAVVSSPTGAAVRDVVNIIHRRFPNTEIIIVPARVQGKEAPQEIAAALHRVNERHLAEIIIVARGGGSLEDLWAFNTEIVARAIAASAIPVISGVGHEIDFTIADFAADLRAPTPSAAAEMAVRDKQELADRLASIGLRLTSLMHHCSERCRSRLQYLQNNLADPSRKITDGRLRQDDLSTRLTQAIARRLSEKHADVRSAFALVRAQAPVHILLHNRTKLGFLHKAAGDCMGALIRKKASLLNGSQSVLRSCNPQSILDRGFSITRIVPSMEVVKNAARLTSGDTVQITFSKGKVDSVVQ